MPTDVDVPVPDRRTLLATATTRLAQVGVATARTDAELLLAYVLGIGRGELVLHPSVRRPDADAYERLVDRRAERVPLQHLTGRAGFRRIEVSVGPGVFVPRPETEAMTGWVIDRLREVRAGDSADRTRTRPVLLELCAGSGVISAAVLDEAPGTRVYAVELDEQAFGYAEVNLAAAVSAGLATLLLADMRDTLAAWPELSGGADVVVANPPYIPLTAYESVAPEARDHDPGVALWSGNDGLDATRMVARVAARALRPGGWVASEHAEVQASSAPAVFTSTGSFDQVRDRPDLAGRPRFVIARRW